VISPTLFQLNFDSSRVLILRHHTVVCESLFSQQFSRHESQGRFPGRPNTFRSVELGDLTFIIEEPRPSFFTPACKQKEDSPLYVCWERWKHIQCFHFVYASPRQAALYLRLDVPHYSESAVKMKSVIAEFLQAHPGQDCISHYHLPHINSITPFLLVFNHLPPSVDTIFTKMDWGCIARTPYSHAEQASKEFSSVHAGSALPVSVC
jgi:hypothetical protein